MRSAGWLAERFGLRGPATLHGPVDQGYQGRIWRLDCGDDAYAVKETSVPLDDVQVALAYEFSTRAAAHGVRAPRQLVTVEGRPVAHDGAETLRLYEWVDLGAPDRALDPEAVGRTLACLHRAGGRALGEVDPWYVEPVGRDRWVELLAELELAGAPFVDELARLLPSLLESEAAMVPADQVQLCHRDLWSDNLRPGPDGPVVIDWDNCGPASAAGELTMVLMDFGTTPARVAALYRAYLEADGPARLTDPGDFTMTLAVLHHLVELGSREWLAASGEHARKRAAARVREFTDEPTGLVEVQEMLAACRF